MNSDWLTLAELILNILLKKKHVCFMLCAVLLLGFCRDRYYAHTWISVLGGSKYFTQFTHHIKSSFIGFSFVITIILTAYFKSMLIKYFLSISSCYALQTLSLYGIYYLPTCQFLQCFSYERSLMYVLSLNMC